MRDAAESHRYEAVADDEVVGYLDYRDRGDVRALPHTFTEPAWRGRGIAERVVRFALDDSRATGMRIAPECGFVARFVETHPEYADLVA